MLRRPRRNRKSPVIRSLVEEIQVTLNDLIYPLFLIEGENQKEEVTSMPGIFRYSLDNLIDEIKVSIDLGINSFCIFPSLPDAKKDKYATEGYNPDSLYNVALKEIKNKFPETCIMTD
ncbi:MAG: porphobilinogen synthase, partial [Flammeovirgaceae bacterium]|nr:porphobilinogen synthase [Flammeovirgaceae bacterium]